VAEGRDRPAHLVLANGEIFEGDAIGAEPAGGVAAGEVVFNTVLSGYQEVITDPSYAGQVITFTNPHIGNYGTTPLDAEARRPFCRGIVIRELARRSSNHRAQSTLAEFLEHWGVPGIAGIDTRRLTRAIRMAGSMPCAFGTADLSVLREAAANEPGTDGVDLVATVTTAEPYRVDAADGAPDRLIVAYDFGIKSTILRHLSDLGSVEVVPATTSADEVLARNPSGVFLSNGPGDPAAVEGVTEQIAGLLGKVPVFGICLGHQLLGRAVGLPTVKLPFGHHGGNHPVKDLSTGTIEITSQNHNFAIDHEALNDRAVMSHVNLNDGVCEGIELTGQSAFGVQHHPEAGPGPHDSSYLFQRFADLMDKGIN
jgi:carbamoyl-phosphate synthase small subunit